ncbi:hypothetical protein EFP18_19660 [Burkholderia glumae]|nr:hypothetical protein DF052_24605 [Burkholderia glumae]UVS86395.1 hypothetical protein EFP18_19660 [Burkholderia glumae]
MRCVRWPDARSSAALRWAERPSSSVRTRPGAATNTARRLSGRCATWRFALMAGAARLDA